MDSVRARIQIGNADMPTPTTIDQLATRLLHTCDEMSAPTILMALGAVMARVARASTYGELDLARSLAKEAVDFGFDYDAADGGGFEQTGAPV